jgi:hypothetical protein
MKKLIVIALVILAMTLGVAFLWSCGGGGGGGGSEITGDLTLDIRAERAGKGQGRTYTIHVVAEDCSGIYNYDVLVAGPHDQGILRLR